MMTPVKMPHTTRVLNAPKDWDEPKDGKCIGLPITDIDGVMYSYWKPSWRQRMSLFVGRPIQLGVFGVGHPPVSVDVAA